MQPMATLMEKKNWTSPPEKHEKVCFCHKKKEQKAGHKDYAVGFWKTLLPRQQWNGELGRVASDVQRAAGVVREDAVWWQHEL